MNHQLHQIQKSIEPLKEQITAHKVYAAIEDLDDLRIFMQYHVFAVWDFMSLLKSLQRNLTCVTVPWFPVGSAETRFLINEIVVGEESDVDSFGNRLSHFELYLNAMKQCGANTTQIEKFIAVLKETGDLHTAFTASDAPEAVRQFVSFTFQAITSGKDYLQSAIFTFAREDLIPAMFLSMIDDLNADLPERVSIFKYYLERHIEVDGGHHSDLALQMTSNLCGTDDARWEEARLASIEGLQKRIALWDGVYEEIKQRKRVTSN